MDPRAEEKEKKKREETAGADQLERIANFLEKLVAHQCGEMSLISWNLIFEAEWS